jgi:hypothetical protein
MTNEPNWYRATHVSDSGCDNIKIGHCMQLLPLNHKQTTTHFDTTTTLFRFIAGLWMPTTERPHSSAHFVAHQTVT